ncbi:MAG: chemotaxis protein methyltransferase CheR [Alphaproteobacteria bacterium]
MWKGRIVKPGDFEFLAGFLKKESGLVLSMDKTYLVESRLVPVARRHGIGGLDDLISAIRGGRDQSLNKEVIEAMTTNESFFFRDLSPFESLKNSVLPIIAEARRKAGASKIRIWSAACSSGQEPYTIAMVLRENPQITQGLPVEILATDLSTEILTKAKEGVYTQFEAQRGMPIHLLMKYFTQVGEHWQINDEIRRMVEFRQANLLQSLAGFGKFDIVFCRNVLIYFDAESKTDILSRMGAQMAGDAYLYLGGAETVIGISDAFKTIQGQRGVYIVAGGDATTAAAPVAMPLARFA